MCNAITNKGTQCSRQGVLGGYCSQHHDQLKQKYEFISDDKFDLLVEKIINGNTLSQDEEFQIKYFSVNLKLFSIVLKYIRFFSKKESWYSSIIYRNFTFAWQTIKDEFCTKPTARRTIDTIEYIKCLEELVKLYIFYSKSCKFPIFEGTSIILKSIREKLIINEKLYAEEQLNILRTKEVGTLNIVCKDVYNHIFVGYL